MMDGTPYPPAGPRFRLVPIDDAAHYAVSLPENYEGGCQSYDEDNNLIGLLIDFSDPGKTVYTLGRFGHNADPPDIHLAEQRSRRGSTSFRCSPLHASFQLIPETGAVLLWDHTSSHSVEPLAGPNSWGIKFRGESSQRSVLIARGINSQVVFGASGREKLCHFDIQWLNDGMYDFHVDEPYYVGPQDSRMKRYVQNKRLGGGSYGTVYSALDAETGKMIAVKRFHNLSGKRLAFATREVDNLKKKALREHPHILRIIDSAGGGSKDNWGEILMPLKEGNLKDLCDAMTEQERWELSHVVLYQMLLALECLANNDVVHRDVKPDNILYERAQDGSYIFCLGDFGLSNDPERAITAAGTEPFMAPEVYNRQKQTTKIDIWSLFATIVWMRNSQFMDVCARSGGADLHAWIISVSKTQGYEAIQTMASHDYKKRPSARRQLDILEAGQFELEEEQNPSDILAAQFAAMGFQGGSAASYGSDASTFAASSPERPYYEPYTTGLYYGNPSHTNGQAVYAPPPMGSSEAPRNQGMHGLVSSWGNSPYGPLQSQGSDEGTVIPDTPTAAPTIAEDDGFMYEEYMEERRRMKGKNRGGI
ncbi:kinase-like domain-containing protein [Cercophora samala]|uniref:Kinase-like domain-containing protein n=1 Tax=Cercophora samala TaxID=330535 RepID=A0AA39ZA35_9PEZI|nr:kinase-like domain-containing protein [Cercophora samala]